MAIDQRVDTEAAVVEFTDEQERHARKLFEAFAFDHPVFRDRDYGESPLWQLTGRTLRGCHIGLGRMMDAIDGTESALDGDTRSEVFDRLTQLYLTRQMKRRVSPELALHYIREELAFVDFAVWQHLDQELTSRGDNYPEGFLDSLEPPREIPRVPTFIDTRFL